MIEPEVAENFLDLVIAVIATGLGLGLLIVSGAVIIAVIRLRRLPRKHAVRSDRGPS